MDGDELLYRIDDRKLCGTVRHDLGQMQSGTYTLIGLDENGKPMTIRRFLADDPGGILYFGMSRNLPDRIGQLQKAICSVYGETGFSGGSHGTRWKIADMILLKQLLPSVDRYLLNIRACQEFKETGEAHWSEHETKMLEAYRLRFGEHPPLNG